MNTQDTQDTSDIQNIQYITKEFISIDKKHHINILTNNNVGWFILINFDATNCNTFVLLLKTIIEYLKKNKIYYVNQHITKNDIEFFNKSEILQFDDDIIAKTKTDYLIDDVVSALNIVIIT